MHTNVSKKQDENQTLILVENLVFLNAVINKKNIYQQMDFSVPVSLKLILLLEKFFRAYERIKKD
jgi:hypothetical protein